MIPNDQPLREQIIRKMIDYLIEQGKELSEWEYDFVKSINGQIDRGKDLSTKQCEILERLYDR